MLDAFVGFDVETTGTDPDQDRIIQIGAVRVEGGRPVARWSALVDPGRPVPPFVRRLTGITDAMLAGRPSLDQLLPGFLDFVGDRPLVAHNAPFDRGFLAAGLRRAGLRAPLPPAYDSLELARLALPGRAGYRLEEVAAGCGVASGRAHDALADAETAALVFLRLLETLGEYPPASLRTAARFLEAAGSTAAPLVAATAARAEAKRDTAAPGRTGGLDAAPPAVAGVAGEPPAASQRWPDLPQEAVASWLLPGGAVARRLPGYEAREGQVEMLRAVAATLAEGGSLLVEAAGGTGRSLAYLLPALARAAALGEPVVVATRTNPLQEQIRSDLARLRGALPFPFRAARVKSRSQYFCRLKWEGVLADPGEDPLALRFFARVALWLARTASGDRGDLNVRREEESAWAAVSADDACAGERCRHRHACAFLEACRRAAAADVVLVDHDLLVADAAAADPLLPPYRRLICDEAHRLPEAASRQFALRVDEAALARLLATLKRRGAREASDAEAAASRLFAALRGVSGETGGRGPAAPSPTRLTAPPAAAREAAAALAAALRRLAGRSPAPEGAVGAAAAQPEPPAAAAGLETAVLAAAEAVEAVFLREAAEGEDPQVTWLESEGGEAGNAGPPALRVVRAPVDPGPALARRLFDRLDAVVLTSATLSVGGGFDYFAREAGLPHARTLRVPPPGDGSRRVLLCLASDAPDPAASGESAYLEAACGFLLDLGVSLGGRTLALFTSHRTLRQVYDRLKDPLEEAGVALLGQGMDGNPARLAEALRASPRAVLLGGASFWDAEDLPAADAVRCVVVMRLPFRPPGHPLAEARLEAAARRGEDPFRALALPEAVLRFKQAFGRLGRAGPARGAAVVLDPRLVSRRDAYGRTFVESLPGPSLFAGTRREVLAAVRDWVDGGDLRAARPEIHLEGNG